MQGLVLKEQLVLTFFKEIEFGPGIPSAQTVKGALDASQAGDQLIRHVFSPILTTKNNWEFQESEEESVLTAKTILGDESRIDVIVTLDKILVFLSKALTDFTSCTDQNTPFFVQIGSHIYEKIADLLIKHWLDPLVPKTYKELNLYPVDIAEKFIKFENKWAQDSSFIPCNAKFLEKYCNDIVSISLEKWRANLLNEAREIIMCAKYDYEIVEPYDAASVLSIIFCNLIIGEKYPESEFDNILQFPKCAVSKRMLELVDLIGKTINDAYQMDNSWYVKY